MSIRRWRSPGVHLLLSMAFCSAWLLAAPGAFAAPPLAQSHIGLPWAVGETATLIAGPHHNLAHNCSGEPPACNSLDFAPASGVVRAAAAGVVHFPYCGRHHKLVVIDHGGGWFTGYYHMPAPTVKEGEAVKAGQALGTIGEDLSCNGEASGPHVHFFVKYVPGCETASAESERCYRKLEDPFRNTRVDVKLDGGELGGWQISGRLGRACMTHVAPDERRCEGQQVTNYATTSTLPGLPSELDVQQPLSVRPAEIDYTGDGSGVLGGFDAGGSNGQYGHMRWSSWSKLGAVGSGAVWIDGCTPNCAEGKFSAYGVTAHAFAPRGGYFTRLTLRYRYKGATITDERLIRREPTSEGGHAAANYSYAILRVSRS